MSERSTLFVLSQKHKPATAVMIASIVTSISSPAMACMNAMYKPAGPNYEVYIGLWVAAVVLTPALIVWLISGRVRELARIEQAAIWVVLVLFGALGSLFANELYHPLEKRLPLLNRFEMTSKRMSDSAKTYFEREQKFGEPWHEVGGEATQQPGYPVSEDVLVFPGGAGFVYSTQFGVGHRGECAALPEYGESIPTVGVDEEGSIEDPTLRVVLELLGYQLEPELLYSLTYETGPDVGIEAWAKVTILLDPDPLKEGCHTIEQRLKIDPETREVVIFPPDIVEDL